MADTASARRNAHTAPARYLPPQFTTAPKPKIEAIAPTLGVAIPYLFIRAEAPPILTSG